INKQGDVGKTIKFPAAEPGRRGSGNTEAVRKYRQKKKAYAAYLEEEVRKLRLLNWQLAEKLQRLEVVESEIVRLRGLLLDLGGEIDEELAGWAEVDRGERSTGLQPSPRSI
ncbi:basic leucine zipper 24-like, partial [Diospyros lotus]|uniref:basic leucine zipper 24-like n=1 Tax=Diospyros lotus TaxID=55363 RepID=UPI0022539049